MDRNALIRALRNTAQSASNTIASNVSGPVDLIAAGLRGVGLPIPQNAIGGSQWMAEKGLTAPVQQGVAQVIGDTIGLAGPALVANFAPQIASALNRGAQNLAAGGAPAMRGQMGGVYMGGPRQEALETAQRNAAKPVSEGGLGLPPNNTPMDRARAMGFDVNLTSSKQSVKDAPLREYFHGTGRNQQAFPEVSTGYNTTTFTEPTQANRHATFLAMEPDFANNFAGQYKQGANVMPLYLRSGNALDLEAGITSETAKTLGLPSSVRHLNKNDVWQIFDDEIGMAVKNKMKSNGYDSAWLSELNPQTDEVVNSVAVIDPSRIRSRFAAFDPARINENDLLGRADPRLLGLMGLGAAGGLGAYNYMQGQ